MIPTRAPLLVEGVKKMARRWEDAAETLKKETKKVHKKVERKIGKMERRGPQEGETPETFANRLLDTQEKVTRKVFNAPKRQKKLVKLQTREQRRVADYEEAERRREEKQRAAAQPRRKVSLVRPAGTRPSPPPSLVR